ncbi:MAG: hypothetical protein L6247_08825 [Desulfobacteraceae bacterium]|nr:hypothetical protein [Desulfobacteraceae bacterium]
MKEILFIIFALLFVVGLIVFRLSFIKDRNPNAELLINLLRWMNANGSEAIQKKDSQDGRLDATATGP